MAPGISKAIVNDDLNQLMKSGSSINIVDDFGNGPLHIAVIKNNASVLDYLLSQETNSVDQQNFEGETALYKAVLNQKFDLAEKLILAGADVNIADNLLVTPLHLAVSVPKMTQLLIKHGGVINCCEKFGQTPLHVAVSVDCLETVCMLLYYNADCTITNDKNYTPFMVALENKNIEIQEVLFEYVNDYEVTTTFTNYSVLGLAIIYNSPFTEEMIIRGANVNNVNRYVNGAFFLTLQYSRLTSPVELNIFKLVWERMDYQPIEKTSVLGNLLLLESEPFNNVIDILINSNKMQIIAQSVSQKDDFSSFVEKCIECQLPLNKFSEFFYVILSYGYTPNENVLTIIFYNWGYCEIFRILLHMNIKPNTSFSSLGNISTRLIREVNYPPNELLNNLVSMLREQNYSLGGLMTITIIHILDNCVYPPLLEAYSKAKKTDCVTLKMKALPKVPSLVELARNQTREHIKKTYKVTNSSQLYTLINNLDISDIYKKILTLESVIYRPIFTKCEFSRYLKMLNMIQLSRPVMDQLIRSAIRYSVVVDTNKDQQ